MLSAVPIQDPPDKGGAGGGGGGGAICRILSPVYFYIQYVFGGNSLGLYCLEEKRTHDFLYYHEKCYCTVSFTSKLTNVSIMYGYNYNHSSAASYKKKN